jgi:hypothetical protein
VQQLEHAVPENGGIRKIVREIVHMPPPGQNLTIDNELPADDEPVGNGKDGAN